MGEVGEIYTGNTPATDNPIYYSNDGIPWITPSDIVDFNTPKPAKYLSEVGLKVGRTVPAGSIMCTCIASIGKNTITSTTCGFNQQINALVPNKEQYDSNFLFAESYLWSQTMKRDAAAGTMQIVNKSEFSELNILKPSLIEQQAIGSFFSRLDHLITLHQRKCRYRGLCGYLSWEQRKLGELCTFSKGHGYSKADIRDAGTPLILYGRLYTQYESRIEEVDTFTVEQDGSILSRGNEVIVPASGETAEDIAVASSVRRSGIILGGDLNVVTPTGKLDPDYTALAITYSKAHDDLAKRAQGKSVVHVHGNDIAEVEISYPSESEQKRISSVVLNLDSLITLHQRQRREGDDVLCLGRK